MFFSLSGLNAFASSVQFWVDQLTPFDLEAETANAMDAAELLTAICSHLRPSPYPYGTLAVGNFKCL